jgi:hypothetical protein
MCNDTALSSYFDEGILNKSFKDAFTAMFDIKRCPHHQCRICHPAGTLLADGEIIALKSMKNKYTHESCKSHWCYEHQLAKTVQLRNDEVCCPMEVCALYDTATKTALPWCLIGSGNRIHCSNICSGCFKNHSDRGVHCSDCKCSIHLCSNRRRVLGNVCSNHYAITVVNSELCRVCGSNKLDDSYADTSSRTFGCIKCRCYNSECLRLIRPGEIACTDCACECLLYAPENVGTIDRRRLHLLDSKVHYIPAFLVGTGFKSISMDRDKQCPNMYKSTQFYLCEKNARHAILTFDPASRYSNSGYYTEMMDYVKKNYDQLEINSTLKVMFCSKCDNLGCADDICFYPTVKGKSACLFHSRPPTVCYSRACHNLVDALPPGLNPVRLCNQCSERNGLFLVNRKYMIYPKAIVVTMMNRRGHFREKVHEFVVGIMAGRRKIKAGQLQFLSESSVHPMKQNLVWFTNLVLYGNYTTARKMSNVQLAALEIDPSLEFVPKDLDQALVAILFVSILPLELAMRILAAMLP